MVVFDATTLMLLLRPDARVPDGPDGKPVSKPKERIDLLVQTLEKAGTKIIIPTPALSELLVRSEPAAGAQIVEHLTSHAVFRVESFDFRAAIELAQKMREVVRGEKKGASQGSPWSKVKFDRQIVAIAKVNSADVIYSNDGDVVSLGSRAGIQVIGIHELPLPPEDPQIDFDLKHLPKEPNTEGG